MFCMYPSCPPSSFLPLQRPVPLWAAAAALPIPPPAAAGGGGGGGHRRGAAQDSPVEGGHDPGSRPGSMSLQGGLEGDHHPLVFFPSKSSDISCGKRRRPGSAGPKFYSAPSSGSHARFPTGDEAPQDRRTTETWDTNSSSSPGIGSGNNSTKIADERLLKSGLHLDCVRNEQPPPFLVYRAQDEDSKDETAASPRKLTPDEEVKSHAWPATSPPAKDDRRSPAPPRPMADGQWGRRTSPHRRSPSPATSPPRNGTLKFGIDRILMGRDRMKDEASVESIGPRFLNQTQHHHHHLHQTLIPHRTLPPLLRIRPPKSPGLAYPPSAVYSPHLFHLQGPPHFPPSSSSSPSCTSSSSSSSLASHLRGHVITNAAPPLHYALHHSFQVPTRLPDFSGNAFALLGSNTDLHSPHLHHHHHHHAQSKKKRSWSRAVFSNLQRKGLEKRFEVQKYVTKPDRRQLAAMLGLTDAQVKVWFQNRRMKWRHQEEALKKKDPESKKPSQRPTGPDTPSAPNGPDGANTPRESTAECAKLSTGRSIHSESDDESSPDDEDLSAEDRGLLFTGGGGRIHAAKSGDAAPLRTGCIMSVADILDLRKNYISGNTGSRTPGTGNDVDDDGGGDVEDDVISVISSAM